MCLARCSSPEGCKRWRVEKCWSDSRGPDPADTRRTARRGHRLARVRIVIRDEPTERILNDHLAAREQAATASAARSFHRCLPPPLLAQMPPNGRSRSFGRGCPHVSSGSRASSGTLFNPGHPRADLSKGLTRAQPRNETWIRWVWAAGS
jgi:hypothetical protein